MCMSVKDKLTSFRLVILLYNARRWCMREYFVLVEHGTCVFIGNSIEYQSVLCSVDEWGFLCDPLTKGLFLSEQGQQCWRSALVS